jgi:glycosyltransferase involved in cell wall biosynthesis
LAERSKPRVSVVIATYNYGHYLAEAIESVLQQSYRDFELTVVDDGSTDDTKRVVTGFGQSVQYVYQNNQGYSAARNVAIRQARGDMIAFLDADDVWLPEKLHVQLDYFDRHPEVGLLSANCYRIDAQGATLGTMPSPYSSGWLFEPLLLRGNPIRMPTVVVRRECFDEVGLFDESLRTTADWDMWLRLSRSYQFGYIDKPLAKYRVHDAAMHLRADQKATDRIAILDKVFAGPDLPGRIEALRSTAYSSAHAVIGRLYLDSGQMRLARKHMFRAASLSPRHLVKPPLVSDIVKTFLGRRLLAWLRALRNRWRPRGTAMEPVKDA